MWSDFARESSIVQMRWPGLFFSPTGGWQHLKVSTPTERSRERKQASQKRDKDKVEERDRKKKISTSRWKRHVVMRPMSSAMYAQKHLSSKIYFMYVCVRLSVSVCVYLCLWMIYGSCLPCHISAWPAVTGVWMINCGCPSDSPQHLWSLAPPAVWQESRSDK